MPNIQGASLEEQVKKLLEQNLAYAKEIYLMNKKIKSYILWGRIMSTIGLLLVVVPLILSVIFLPAFLDKYLGNFLPIAPSQKSGNIQDILKGSNLNQAEILKAVQDQGGILNAYKNLMGGYDQEQQ